MYPPLSLRGKLFIVSTVCATLLDSIIARLTLYFYPMYVQISSRTCVFISEKLIDISINRKNAFESKRVCLKKSLS